MSKATIGRLHNEAIGKIAQFFAAPTEQRHLQAAAKERDMLDALWILQTLIADFGYAEVETHVLQHLRLLPGD